MNLHVNDLFSHGARRESLAYARGAVRLALFTFTLAALAGFIFGSCK